MPAQTSYDSIVNENLKQMGSDRSEWSAVPVKGMVETTNDRGDAVSMPEFEFPQGYAPAPSMFRNDKDACNLCGHCIKNVFWIQNDSKRWVMPVGCECVTHFGARVNGTKAAKQSIALANREKVASLERARRLLKERFANQTANYVMRGGERVQMGVKTVWGYTQEARNAKEVYEQIGKLLGHLTAKVGCCNRVTGKYDASEPVWTDRQIANWLKKNGVKVDELLLLVSECLRD